MAEYPFTQVDVFAAQAYDGNPVAVVLDADGISSVNMQRFARWTNLAETTFVLRPSSADADYSVRIFTTTGEVPFAGHPTLGSAHAWREFGGRPRRSDVIVQHCAAGNITIRSDGPRLAFAAPPLTRFEPVAENVIDQIATGLGVARSRILDCAWLVNGLDWIGVRLASAAQVLDLRPNWARLGGLQIGVIGPHRPGADADFEVRALLADDVVPEDPVTGSVNAGLAHWLITGGQAPPSYVAAQGTAIGRSGRVHVDLVDGTLWIGGRVHTSIRGTVALP